MNQDKTPYLTSISPITFDGEKYYKALNFYGLDLTSSLNVSEQTMIVVWEEFEYTLKMKDVFSRDENNLVCSSYELDVL